VETVTCIAKRVRAWTEAKASKYGYAANLQGLCGIASRKLFRELKRAGYSPTIGYARNYFYGGHAFVVLNGRIVDVTATQFRCRQKVVVSKLGVSKRWYWKPAKHYSSDRAFLNYQQQSGWSGEQVQWQWRPLWEEVE